MKYSNNLELLTKKDAYLQVTEDEIFYEIEELEKKEDHKKAANLLSIYINFMTRQTYRILINKSRKCVKLLIKADLVNSQDAGEDAIYIYKKTRLGMQAVSNYSL